MADGFAVSAPDLTALIGRMKRVDFTDIYGTASVQAAQGVASAMAARARSAGHHRVAASIGVYTDDGVVHAGSEHDDAFDSEYGTLTGAPAGWMRNTVADSGSEIAESFADELSLALERAL
jgi:hypothetical protein